MDLLKDWLASTIEQELNNALRWKEREPTQTQFVDEDGKVQYVDDGSNLRIRCSEKGQVQVCKFMTFRAPITIIISDKYTRIQARISDDAIRQFEKLHRKAFTKGSVGGIIQIREYELVATHIGPRSARLSLYVTDFRYIGAEGSGQFGVPRPIETVDQERKSLLKQLQDMRAQERVEGTHSTSTPTSSVASPSIYSQRVFQFSDEPACIREETELATQLPYAFGTNHLSKASKPKFPADFEYRSPNSSPKRMLSDHELPNGSDLGPLSRFPQSKSPKEQVLGDKAKSSHNQQRLIGILRQHQEGTRIKAVSPVRSPLNKPQESEERPIIEDESRSYDMQNFEGVHYPKPGTELPEADTLRGGNEPAMSGYELKVVSRMTMPSDENSHPIRHELKAPQSTQTGCAESSEAIDVQKAKTSTQNYHVNKKRKIGNGISDREILIGKDQDALLARSDSWLPVQPGQRDLSANVPISILQTLNRQADMNARKIGPPENDINDGHLPQICQTQSSESDEPIPASDWPSSPIREVLPVDSSPPIGQEPGFVEKSQPSQIIRVRVDSVSNASSCSPDMVSKENGAIPAAQREPLPMFELSDSSTDDPRSQERNESEGRAMPSSCQMDRQQSPDFDCDGDKRGNVSARDGLETLGPWPEASILSEDEHQHVAKRATQTYPCTASPNSQPFTQVKRTPYVNDDEHGRNLSSLTEYPGQASASLSITPNDAEVTHVTSTLTPLKSSSTHQMTAESGHSTSKPSETKLHKSSANGHSVGFGGNSDSDADFTEEKHPSTSTEPTLDAGPEDFGKNHKRSMDDVVYPSQSKRRRTLPVLPVLDMSQIPEDLPDPAISARQHRRDWFAASRAARRDSASSISRDSFASPAGRDIASLRAITREASNEASPIHTPHSEHRQHSGLEAFNKDASTDVGRQKVINEDAVPLLAASSLPEPMPVVDLGSISVEHLNPSAASGENPTRPSEAESSPRPDQVSRPFHDGESVNSKSIPGNCNDLSGPLNHQSLMNSSLQDDETVREMAIFSKFKNSYPAYPGDAKHFKARLRNLLNMHKAGKITSGYNLDDYIIRNKIEYAKYLQLCAEEGDDPMSYDDFYHQKIAEPRYLNQVLTMQDLGLALPQEISKTSSPRGKSIEAIQAGRSAANGTASTRSGLPGFALNESNKNDIIDLTNDKPASPTTICKSGQSVRRSLPWTDLLAMARHQTPQRSSQVISGSQSRLSDQKLLRTSKAASPSVSPKSNLRSTTNGNGAPIPNSFATRLTKVSFSQSPAIIGSQKPGAGPLQEMSSRNPVAMTSTRSREPRAQSIQAHDSASGNHAPETCPASSLQDNVNTRADARTSRLDGKDFWRDEDAPFKVFVRAYEAIQPGKGNAWATPEQVQWGKEECERRKFHPRGINISSWHS